MSNNDIFSFNNKRYITCGIQSKVPPLLIIYLWNIIENFVNTQKRFNKVTDYLQTFNLSVDLNRTFVTIYHKQEQPSYAMFHTFPIGNDERFTLKFNSLKIFVIDDMTHSTMLLAEEY